MHHLQVIDHPKCLWAVVNDFTDGNSLYASSSSYFNHCFGHWKNLWMTACHQRIYSLSDSPPLSVSITENYVQFSNNGILKNILLCLPLKTVCCRSQCKNLSNQCKLPSAFIKHLSVCYCNLGLNMEEIKRNKQTKNNKECCK